MLPARQSRESFVAEADEGKGMANRLVTRRRAMAESLAISAGISGSGSVLAAGKLQTAIPPSVATTPPRQWGKDATPG